MVTKCGIHKRQCRLACACSIVVGAAIAPDALAFQSASPLKNHYPSCASLNMVDTMYSFGKEDRISSFLGPLLPHDYELHRPRRSNGGSRLLSTSSLIFSSKGSFSFLEGSNMFDDEEESLKYLPSGGTGLTPKTKELLQRVTSEYVNKREPIVEVDDVLDVIDEEYKSRDVSVIVGEKTFDFLSSGDVDDADVARILSFAAHHRLPLDISLILFGPVNSDTNDAFAKCRKALGESDSWMSVSFPQGLAIRPKRKFVTSTRKRFLPVPRTWTTSRKEAVRHAQLAVNEAMYVQPPPRRLLTREEFLATMDKELSAASEPTELLPSLFREARLFFPRQNQKLKRLRKVVKKQFALIKDAGLAGLISYSTLSVAWYTCAIVFQWRCTTPTVEISSRALRTALRRFGKVLAGVYIGSQITRLLRIKIALRLRGAPFGNRAIRYTQKKFGISETKAFAVLSGAVAGTCLAMWSIIALGDSAVLRRTAGALAVDQATYIPAVNHIGFEPSL
jgi:hypothetical protein